MLLAPVSEGERPFSSDLCLAMVSAQFDLYSCVFWRRGSRQEILERRFLNPEVLESHRKCLWKILFVCHSQALSQSGIVGAMRNGKVQPRASSRRSPIGKRGIA